MVLKICYVEGINLIISYIFDKKFVDIVYCVVVILLLEFLWN